MQKTKFDRKKDQRASGDIYEKIEEDILTGAIPDGSRLTETEICKKYGVSRTPARESLTMLSSHGLIKLIPNRGAVVTRPSAQDLSDMCRIYYDTEVDAAGWAAERITDDESEKLEEIFGFMKFYTMKDDLPKMINFNSSFHRMIFYATHDPFVINMMTLYQKYIDIAAPVNYYTPNYLKDVLYDHRAIYEAIQAHDAKKARAAMKRYAASSIKRRAL
jgi:DNA-binding GntR family transcriptional regulator